VLTAFFMVLVVSDGSLCVFLFELVSVIYYYIFIICVYVCCIMFIYVLIEYILLTAVFCSLFHSLFYGSLLYFSLIVEFVFVLMLGCGYFYSSCGFFSYLVFLAVLYFRILKILNSIKKKKFTLLVKHMIYNSIVTYNIYVVIINLCTTV
jgi:hypothetical protein